MDFVSLEKRLIIEVDGGQHTRCSEDEARDEWLKGQRFEVIRFWNHDVLKNREGVIEKIAERLIPPSLTLPQRGREAEFERWPVTVKTFDRTNYKMKET